MRPPTIDTEIPGASLDLQTPSLAEFLAPDPQALLNILTSGRSEAIDGILTPPTEPLDTQSRRQKIIDVLDDAKRCVDRILDESSDDSFSDSSDPPQSGGSGSAGTLSN